MDELYRKRHPVIPRTGYIVEFNALWYNALRFVADLVREGGDAIFADVLDAQAEVTGSHLWMCSGTNMGICLIMWMVI